MTKHRSFSTNEIIEQESNVNWLVVLMAIGLHQSIVFSGINFSVADVFLLLFITTSMICGKFEIPLLPLLFFIVLSITSVLSATYITPSLFHVSPDLRTVLVAWMKLISLLLYFIAGYLIVKQKKESDFLMPFAYAGIFIGVVSILLSFVTFVPLQDSLFFGGDRFKGFLNDPNLYAVTTIASFAVFLSYKNPKWWIRIFLWILLFWCVALSGSKTGVIVTICYLLISILIKNFHLKKPRMQSLFLTFIFMLVLLFFQLFQKLLIGFGTWMSVTIPGAERLLVLFSDFNMALGEGGSSRTLAWQNAWIIIKESPVFGVGIGTYGDVSNAMFGSRLIAHNTFLQLFAEWGIPLTMIFTIFVVSLIFRHFNTLGRITSYNNFIDVVLILLIASMAISLNNARLFWICLGGLMFQCYQNRAMNQTGTSIDTTARKKLLRQTHVK